MKGGMQNCIEMSIRKIVVSKLQVYLKINRNTTQRQKGKHKEIQKRNLKKLEMTIKKMKKAIMNKNKD